MKKIFIILFLFSLILQSSFTKPIDRRLYYVAKRGKIELVKKLIKKGANINFETLYYNHYSETPLIVASEKGYTEIVEILLENGADPNIDSLPWFLFTVFFDPRYDTELLRAIDNGHKKIVELLVQYGSNVNCTQIWYGFEENPLILAQKKGYKDIEKILLEAGASTKIILDE